MGWLRGKDIPTEYPIGKTYAYELLKHFVSEADPHDFIKDGKVLIVRQTAFEDWWRRRRRK